MLPKHSVVPGDCFLALFHFPPSVSNFLLKSLIRQRLRDAPKEKGSESSSMQSGLQREKRKMKDQAAEQCASHLDWWGRGRRGEAGIQSSQGKPRWGHQLTPVMLSIQPEPFILAHLQPLKVTLLTKKECSSGQE
jgi:hypothetical protein